MHELYEYESRAESARGRHFLLVSEAQRVEYRRRGSLGAVTRTANKKHLHPLRLV